MSRRALLDFRDWCQRGAADTTVPAAERALWRALAEEIGTYLAEPAESVDLFGQAASEPTTSLREEGDDGA